MLKRLGCLAVLTLCLAALAPAGASAATVANTNDSGPGSLRQAIADATPGETIVLPAGNYELTSGQLVIEKSLTISGAGAGSTTIRGGGASTFGIEGEGNSVTISGVTLRGTERNEVIIAGGVIHTRSASLTLSHVVIAEVSNTAASAGGSGGIIDGGVIYAEGGSLAILDSTIDHVVDSAAGKSGHNGGIVDGGAVYEEGGKLTIERSSITDVSVDVRGGQGPSSSAQNGGIADGGGVFAGETPGGSAIGSSTFGRISLVANGGPGATGGIAEGGGLFISDSKGEFVLSRDTIADNSTEAASGTTEGGGIDDGGGAFLAPTSGTGTIGVRSSTIASNRSGEGGGLFGTEGLHVANTIVAANSGAPGEQNCYLTTSEPISEGHNLDSADECEFHGLADIVNADPQLGPLQNNGGPVETMLPAGTSPVVDKGVSLGLTTDARGLPRPIDFPAVANAAGGDGSDIGAVEVQASNSFSFGKFARNKKKGSAKLTINLPAPPNAGTLTLSGKGLKSQSATLTGTATSVTLPVVATGKVLKALKKRGKRAIGINITLQPPGNSAASQTLKTKLFKKLKKKHHKRKHHRKHAKHHKKKR